jgi:hypothetical protein
MSMAFEDIIVRTGDGSEYGPITMAQLVQWYGEGRVSHDATLVDATTREERPVSAFPQFAYPPPPYLGGQPPPPQPRITAADHLIPTKNPKALAAYYCGVFAIACGMILGPIAIALGILGFREAKTLQVGRTHAIVGIIGGAIATLLWLVPTIIIVISSLRH